MASKGISEKFHPPVTLILPKRMFGSKKVGLLEQTGVSSFHGYTTTWIEMQHFAMFVCKLTMKASF